MTFEQYKTMATQKLIEFGLTQENINEYTDLKYCYDENYNNSDLEEIASDVLFLISRIDGKI